MYKEKIEAYMESHKKEMIEDIFTLCRINSEKMPYQEGKPYGEGPYRALTTALNMAEEYGFAVKNYDNYVGAVDFNDREQQLDILAHLDVVPGGEGWTVTEAFEPIEKDGKLFGRGTADDKGPAIAALYAMRAVKALGIPLSKNIRLLLGTDEECGSSDVAHYYQVEKEAPMTFSPDGSFPVVNVEKGGLKGNFSADFKASEELPALVSLDAGIKINVVPGKAKAVFKGFDDNQVREAGNQITTETGVTFEISAMDDTLLITAVGEAAHASTPEEGKNALTALLLLISRLPFASCEQITMLHRLLELYPHGDCSGRALGIEMEDEVSGKLTLAFSLLKVDNSSLEGQFDSRTPICANEDNALKVAKDKMESAGFTWKTTKMNPSHHVPGDSPFVKNLLKNYELYTGLKGECMAMGGNTYVHHLKNGVAFGASLPGTDNRMHGPDEFAVVDELMICAKIFAQVIIDLCQ